MSEIIFDVNSTMIQKKMKSKNRSLLDELDDIEEFSDSIQTISTYRPTKEKKKKREEYSEEDSARSDDWLRSISEFKEESIKVRRKNSGGVFDYLGEKGGKKKKKKKKDDDIPDFGKEFEPEMYLLRNLLADQNRFIDSLQKRYDTLEGSKTSVRGIGKFQTDLINAINQGRGTALQITNGLSSLKKTVADLTMKERKERGNIGDSENMADFSANFLKQVLTENRHDLSAYGNDSPVEGNEDDIFNNLSSELADVERSDDIEKYLKYEDRDVKIVAVVDRDTEEYHLEAVASDGEVLDDYPIPQVSSLSINKSTEVASDEYHTKYPIRWV